MYLWRGVDTGSERPPKRSLAAIRADAASTVTDFYGLGLWKCLLVAVRSGDRLRGFAEDVDRQSRFEQLVGLVAEYLWRGLAGTGLSMPIQLDRARQLDGQDTTTPTCTCEAATMPKCFRDDKVLGLLGASRW